MGREKGRKQKKRGGEERRTGVLSNADDESWGGGGGAAGWGGSPVYFFSFSEHRPPPPHPPRLLSPLLSLSVTAGVGNAKRVGGGGWRTKTSSLSSLGSTAPSDATKRIQQGGQVRRGEGVKSKINSTIFMASA